MEPNQGRAAKLYTELAVKRQPYLDRARLAARYTIPALFPPQGTSGFSDLHLPFQSIGARGVNNLANKLLLALLPPTRRFYRLIIGEKLEREIPAEEKSEWELALSRMEASIDRKMETLSIRSPCYEAFRHLIVGGNVLLFVWKDTCRMFSLEQYVVRRTPSGDLVELVVEECVRPEDLPNSVREQVIANLQADNSKTAPDKTVKVYTHVYRINKVWHVYQEVHGLTIPESVGRYGKNCPWLALRWTRIDGEDYGRSHCDDYLGDLIASESLSRSIIRAAAVAAKVVFLCRPNSSTRPEDLEQAQEGDFVDGDVDDVAPLGLEKFSDFQIAKATLEEVNARLSYAFLLNSAIRREGERVTAEEIRYMAAELEDTLGGVYSLLALEFQLPLIRTVKALMERAGELPSLPDKAVEPTIITGIDALGRSHELARLDAFLGGALQTFGPEVIVSYVNISDYLRRRAAGLDLDPEGLIFSEQEVQQQKQAMAMQSIAEKATGPVIKAVSDAATAAGPSPTGS